MKQIVIADAHHVCREALSEYIRHAEQDFFIQGCGDYESLSALLIGEAALGRLPDMVLMARDLPGLSTEAFFTIKNPIAKVGLMINPSFEESGEDLNQKIDGIFPKNLSCKDFMTGIQEVLSGKRFLPPRHLSENPLNAFSPSQSRTTQNYNLTNREKEVLGYLVKGSSNKEIARSLNLQVVTVKLHVRGICRKMKANNRTQAALLAKETGWG